MKKTTLRMLALVMSMFIMMSVAVACAPVAAEPVATTTENEAPAAVEAPAVAAESKVIGISVSDLRLERWQRDVNLMTEKAKELGYEVVTANANADETLQLSQCENLISQGVDVLIVVAQNGEVMGPVVDQAHDAGIKVIAYERLFMNCDLDYYVTFDGVDVGVAQATSLINIKPTGKYFLLGGSPTDNNAKIFRSGQMEVLQPLIDSGDITVVGDQWVKNWDTNEAFTIVENALTANNNDIDVIVATNDSTAQGAVQAIIAQGLEGKILVSGQDADLVSCQYIVEGKQTSTVYKPLKNLAWQAIEIADMLFKGEAIEAPRVLNNGKIDVPSWMLKVTGVTKDNMMETVIADGFQDFEEVYKNVPADQRPTKP